MDLTKKKRIVCEELLAAVRRMPCVACTNRTNYREAMAQLAEMDRVVSHPHHLISRGAGGDDIASNLMPLCFRCHTEVHKISLDSMAMKYNGVSVWLRAAGWVKTGNKWRPG